MKMRICCVIPLVLGMALSQDSADIKYLGGVSRPDDSSIMDYYFSCNVVGPRLDWQINNDAILSYIGSETVGQVEQITVASIQSLATLLSISQVGMNRFSYVSILIVSSTTRNIAVPVSCFVGSVSVNTSNLVVGEAENSVLPESSGNVFLQYLFPANITDGTLTHVFFCGVNDTVQEWQVGSSQPLLLGSSDPLGSGNQTISNNTLANNTLAIDKTVRIGRDPSPLSSVLFVTRPQLEDVRCSSASTNAVVTAARVIMELQQPQNDGTTMMPPIETTATPAPTDSSPAFRCDGLCVGITIILIIIGLLGIFICSGVITIVLRRWCCDKICKKKAVGTEKLHATI